MLYQIVGSVVRFDMSPIFDILTKVIDKVLANERLSWLDWLNFKSERAITDKATRSMPLVSSNHSRIVSILYEKEIIVKLGGMITCRQQTATKHHQRDPSIHLLAESLPVPPTLYASHIETAYC